MTTKNIAVFCESWTQMNNYVNDLGHPIKAVCYLNKRIRVENLVFSYMNGYTEDSIKGVRWDAILHLPNYQKQPVLIRAVERNLKEHPVKTKKQQLIEELEQKLAELKKEEGL